MTKFIWKSVYTIEPGLRESEKIGDYFFKVREDGKTVVERIHETSSYDELHPERKNEHEYAEETLSRIEADRIREIMLRRMIYQRVFKPINVIPLKSPELVNKDELVKTGIELKRTMSISIGYAFAILDVDDSIAKSETFWNSSFQGKARGQQGEIIRIADWFERSVEEKDLIKSFILSWIGFNGLYNLLALLHNVQKSEAEKFEFMIDQLIKEPPQAQNIVKNIRKEIDALETYNITSDRGKKNLSCELHCEMKNTIINNLRVLKLVARCIYGVRNQAFHAAPKPEDILERVKISRAALIPISLICLKNIITH